MSTKLVQKKIDDASLRVAVNFRRLRLARGWTLEEAAQASGKFGKEVSYGYVGHIERGITGLGKRARAKWALIFDVSESEFYKPINDEIDLFEAELDLLKMEARQYSLHKIKHLRELMPILLRREESKKHADTKATRKTRHKKAHKKAGK